jgi:hypothetical protein
MWISGASGLRMFVAVAALVGHLTNPVRAHAVWEYLENRDPHAKGLVAMAHFADPSGAHAMVRCWSATRVFDLRLGFPGVGDPELRDLQLQFDVVPSVAPNWRLSPNRRSVIVAREHHAPVLAGLRRANNVSFLAGFADGTQREVALDLRGSSVAIGRVVELCAPSNTTLR